MVTVKLDKAEQHDKIIFLIKTYNNIPSTWNAKVIYPLLRSQRVVNPYYNLIEMSLCADESCELWLTSTMPKNHLLCILRDPLLLQLVAACWSKQSHSHHSFSNIPLAGQSSSATLDLGPLFYYYMFIF